MPDTFLHGVETIEVASSEGTVTAVKSAVIGLIGTSVTGTANKLYLSLSEANDMTHFGAYSKVATDTIPNALRLIRKENPKAVVFVISVGTGATTPTESDFAGAVNVATGVKTGLKLFETCRALYGLVPKIFIAPGFSSTAAIAADLEAAALTYRGCAYLDSPTAMLFSAALTARGVAGLWTTASYRTKLLFSGLIDFDNKVVPASASSAGLRSFVDENFGFWYSSSNHTLKGAAGIETPLSFEINDSNSEVNLLNAQGITTFVNVYGAGIREWGNRNGAFPLNADSRTFEAMQRLDDISSESIELACLPYLDLPMSPAQINLVTEMVNGYFNTLISRGALIQGSKCLFEAAKNTPTEMAKGHYVWTKNFMGATPGERFTFYSVIDTTLLSNLLNA